MYFSRHNKLLPFMARDTHLTDIFYPAQNLYCYYYITLN